MPAPTSTFALLEKAKTGDEEALSRAFEKHRRRLAVLIHYRLSPHARQFYEVEDLVQETHLRAFRDFGRVTYQAPGSFLRWLSSIADRVIVDRMRYQNRERRPARRCRSGRGVILAGRSRPTPRRPAACSPSKRR